MSLIVIVDDRSTNRNIFAKLAASIEPDITVRTFADPDSALAWLADNAPDLVITDYKMPGMDGAEFIRRFRELPDASDIPVIVITVYEERTFRLRALEAGATDFLHSPVDHHEFVTRARNLLKLHKHQLLLAARATSLAQELEHSERTRERELRDSSERLAQVIDTLPMMISATAPDGRIVFANAAFNQFLGCDAEAVVGRNVATVLEAERAARSLALDRVVFEGRAPIQSFEEELVGASGERRHFLTGKFPIMSQDNAVTAILTSSLDLTAQKRTEAHLRHMAHHDPLTGLANRVLLHESLRAQIVRARRGDQVFALHLLDLDGFKTVNDLLGHSAGDRYIRSVADRLRAAVREEDTLARLGGDEFAVIQTHVANSQDAADFARRLLDVVSSADQFEGAPARATASIGIALHPEDGGDCEELLKNADMAMYRAKVERGNRYCFFAADMNERLHREASLDRQLRLALDREEFVVWYQPQIDLKSGRIIGAEALVRWNRPQFGLVQPGAFLPRAEENGLMRPITEWVLGEACRAARRWQTHHGTGVPVAVNLSPSQLTDGRTPRAVSAALSAAGLDPRFLELEITESTLLDQIDCAAGDLARVRDMGVRIAMDDFGVGYSSLSYVKRLPVTRIKIDQCFVRDLHQSLSDLAIVRAIVHLGHGLGLEILAEGVETASQAQQLREEGCDFGQGYHFARPMPEDEFVRLLLSNQAFPLSA